MITSTQQVWPSSGAFIARKSVEYWKSTFMARKYKIFPKRGVFFLQFVKTMMFFVKLSQ